jgi:hypothetical protein
MEPNGLPGDFARAAKAGPYVPRTAPSATESGFCANPCPCPSPLFYRRQSVDLKNTGSWRLPLNRGIEQLSSLPACCMRPPPLG